MYRRLLRGNETCAHVHPGAPIANGHEASRIGHAAGGDEWDLQFVSSAWEEDHVRHIIFAGMAAALKAIDTHRVAASKHRRQVRRLGKGGMPIPRKLTLWPSIGIVLLQSMGRAGTRECAIL